MTTSALHRTIDRVEGLLRYLRAFGGAAGLRAFLSKRKKQGIITLRIPSVQHPLYIRAGTSDLYMFEEVFIDDEYGLSTDLDPKVIVDAGANVGYASIYFANRYPGARIFAIEPEPSNAAILRRNVAAYPNVQVLEAAIWHEATTLELEDTNDSSGFRVQAGSGAGARVQAMTVEDVMTLAGANRIDILKIDIEGAEKELFEKNPPWLAKVGVLMIELHDRFKPGCSRALFSALTAHDFREMRHATANWFVNGGVVGR